MGRTGRSARNFLTRYGLEKPGYNRGSLIWYVNGGFDDNDTGLHPGGGLGTSGRCAARAARGPWERVAKNEVADLGRAAGCGHAHDRTVQDDRQRQAGHEVLHVLPGDLLLGSLADRVLAYADSLQQREDGGVGRSHIAVSTHRQSYRLRVH